MQSNSSSETSVTQLLKNFPTFCGTRRFIAAFVKAQKPSSGPYPEAVQSIPVRTTPYYFCNIQFNIVLPFYA
jgi:hypothetical protein